MSRPSFNSISSTLADYTDVSLIIPEVKSRTAPGALGELCFLAERQGRLQNAVLLYDAVIAREKLCPTSFMSGWALPHARLNEIPELFFALARTTEPLKWFGNPGVDIQTIFLFGVPDLGARDYLNIVAAVARLSQDLAKIEQLRAATDPLAILKLLEEVPVRKPGVPKAASFTSDSRAPARF